MRERRGRVSETRQLATRVTLLAIDCVEPKAVTSRAGQFVSIRVPGGGRRSYSIVSGQGASAQFEIVLKEATPTGGTSDIVAALELGTEVSFFGPMGYFLFDPPDGGEVLFGATGVGISALLPMIELALASSASRVELFWGLRDPNDLFFSDRLELLAADQRFSYTVYYSAQGDGYINEPFAARVDEVSDPHIYLCGHGQMITDVTAHLDREIVRQRVHTEVFYPAVSPISPD